jgi:hypothetical protein
VASGVAKRLLFMTRTRERRARREEMRFIVVNPYEIPESVIEC